MESTNPIELAERLMMWARVGNGGIQHSQDCDDASNLILTYLKKIEELEDYKFMYESISK